VALLKKKATNAKKIFLATDEDREGEAISWHLVNALGLEKKETARIVFHEITKSAIDEAIKTPRELDIHLVDAQQARRILDRLVGYKLSPFLWAKVRRGLSAGRVQSVAVRLICEREDEINAFKPQEYWSVEVDLEKDGTMFTARLAKQDGKTVNKLDVKNGKEAQAIVNALSGAEYKVISVVKKEKAKNGPSPFTTSTMQQAAGQKLGFSAKRTMMVAQQLYEGIEIGSEEQTGLITYMRTDSLNLATSAVQAAREFIEREYGKDYLPTEPKTFRTKSKGAQEAHEAIRPSDPSRHPDKIRDALTPDQYKLYSLIWSRMIACQMNPAKTDATTVDIEAKNFVFRASGSVITFDGYLRAYNDVGSGTKNKDVILPALAEGDRCDYKNLRHEQHFTQPPARYNESSLVKTLEELGIGRPSTYAPIMSTIQDRGYVEKEDKKFKPTEIGVLVNKVLVEHFATIVDYAFTAQMEKELDEIAEGKREWVPVIRDFYLPFEKNLGAKDKELDKKELTEETTDKKCPKSGHPLVLKFGRFGKFYACSGYPECKYTEPVEKDKEEIPDEYKDVKCPKCGKPMKVKFGRFGKFLGCTDYPECKGILPIEKKTGVPCPKCGKGEIIEKRSRRGKVFYACNKYPDCDQSYWNKPVNEKCPKTGDLLVYAAKGKLKCSNKECDFIKDIEQKDE
jgi:DNA topoisomerase-1